MTVRELIKELIEFDIDNEIVIDFTPKDIDVTVDSGLTEGDDMKIEMNECNGTDISLNTYRHENHRRVHIEVKED